MICSPSSIAFARTTSSSAESSATLPISLRYIRTGSSIPIMSAESASSSSRVGSSTSSGGQLRGRLEALGHLDPLDRLLLDDLDRELGGDRAPRSRRPRSRSSSSSSSSASASGSAETGATAAPARRGRIVASFASSSSRLVRRGRDESTASTSCLSRGSAMSAGPPRVRARVGREWWSVGGGRGVVGRSGPGGQPAGHGLAGEESGLVAPPVERAALLVEEPALERQPVDQLAVAVALRLAHARRGSTRRAPATRHPRARG